MTRKYGPAVRVLAFLVLVAAPAFRATAMQGAAGTFEQRCLCIVWLALAANPAVRSGMGRDRDRGDERASAPRGCARGLISIILTKTNFGTVSSLRLGLAALLAPALAVAASNDGARGMALACAAGLLGALACTGHAAGTVGSFWTLGQYDVVVVVKSGDELTMTALSLSLGALGNVHTQTLDAFSEAEMQVILRMALWSLKEVGTTFFQGGSNVQA